MANPEPVLDRLLACTADEERAARAQADVRLASLLRQDPHAAARGVYERFQADVNRWVWRLLGADPDHNDIVQQIFVRVIRSAKQLRDTDRLTAWVHAIAANTVYGELRKREIRRLFMLRERATVLHADMVRDIEIRDLLLRTKAIIDRIPAKSRVVFVLHVVEGRTLGEIAELCGYSEATAKRRFAAGNARFQLLLRREPELARALSKRIEDP
jgi:RNA polymerase sigma-70 factor, ECF subfamily